MTLLLTRPRILGDFINQIMIDSYGRYYDNSHISEPSSDIREYMRHHHTSDEIATKLHTNNGSLYDADGQTDNFSSRALKASMDSARRPITIYETDKVKDIVEGLKAIDEKTN